MSICKFRGPCIAILWTLALTLMAGSIRLDDRALAAASLLVALVAWVPSGWLIVEHVVHTELTKAVLDICEAVGYAEAEGKLRHLR